MKITEHAINALTTVATQVQARFSDFSDLAHGWEHTHRVYHLALILSDQEHADGFIAGMAALLHDLGRITRGPSRSHAERSAKLAATLLARYDLPSETQHVLLHEELKSKGVMMEICTTRNRQVSPTAGSDSLLERKSI